MKFKKIVTTMCVASAMTCIMTPLQQAIADEVQKPNFVTIVIDDMGFSDLGAFGGEVNTPNIDQLADTGTVLSNFYAASTSSPSRSMLFTGKDNHPAGMGNMGGSMREEQRGEPGYEGIMSLDALPFPELLQQNNYHTMMVGKWHMGEEEEYYAHNRGFSETRALLLPGGDAHFLSDENGDNITTINSAKMAASGRTTMYNENGEEMTKFPPNAYATDYYTDLAIDMLDTRDKSKPFYLNMSYLAPHTPIQAPKDVIDQYVDTYSKGWDIIRKERFDKLRALGYLAPDAELSPRPDNIPAWDSLPDDQKAIEARRMAIYAAMIDKLDQNVGRLVQHLKDIGDYDNTVFFVYSDNGAETEAPIFKFGGARLQFILDSFPYSIPNYPDNITLDELLENMGGSKSHIDLGMGWATVSNAPFNNYKVTTFDGGVRTAMFAHYPQSKATGIDYNCLSSVMDIAPTILDMAEVEYPNTHNGKPIAPMQGVSMANVFKGKLHCNPERYLGWEMNGIKGIRQGNWKLSQQLDDENWYLYDLTTDPYELNELSTEKPEKLQSMIDVYQQYATDNEVIDVGVKQGENLGIATTGAGDVKARIEGGSLIIKDGLDLSIKFYKKAKTVKSTDTVEIISQMKPAKQHVGLPATISVYSKIIADSQESYWALTPNGWEIFENGGEVPAYSNIAELSARHLIPVFKGKFGDIGLIGNIEVWLDYQLEDGTAVSSQEPISIEITD